MENAKLFKLGWHDLLKGLVVVVLAATFAGLIALLQSGAHIPYLDNPQVRLIVATALAYLSKNLLTDENDHIAGVKQL